MFLGRPEESILSANKTRRALGILFLASALGQTGSTPDEQDTFVKSKIENDDQSLKASDFNWFITIIIERTLNLSEWFVPQKKYFWIKASKANELDRTFKEYASPYIDLIAATMSSVIDPKFLDNVTLEDRVFFFSNNLEPFGVPHYTGSGSAFISRNMESFNLQRFEKLYQSIPIIQNQCRWLDTLKYWRLAALTEQDRYKQFLWSFLALEILTNKMAYILYDDVTKRLCFSENEALIPRVPCTILTEILIPRERLTLKGKFTVMGLGLSPETIDDDLKSFVEAKKARDLFSHGAIIDADNLPNSTVASLLQKYFVAAIEHIF
jgi:hypothetical protein